MIAPISAFVHIAIANMITNKNYTVLDMGGNGKLKTYVDNKVTDANIINGIDCTNMPFDDNSFDISVSIAVLEHVKDQDKFIQESIRVTKKKIIHWFPVGECAQDTELLKKRFGYKHPCIIPDLLFFNKYDGWKTIPFMTCESHLLSLMSMNVLKHNKEIYDFIIDNKNEYYGYFMIKEIY